MMDPEEEAQQQKMHDLVSEIADMPEGVVLAGWIVIYEFVSLKDDHPGYCGHIYGPRELTTWRALGLIEWIRRFCLGPGEGPGE